MDIFTRERGIYRFGPYRLDPARRALIRDGNRVALSARLFDTLLILVEAQDRLVTREALQAAIWQNRAVDDNNLGQAIAALRRTLQAGPESETYIVTVAGRGYRFGVPVAFEPAPLASDSVSPGPEQPTSDQASPETTIPDLAAPTPPEGAPACEPPPRLPVLRSARGAWRAMVLALCAIVLSVWLWFGPGHIPPSSAPLPPSVADLAVLPAPPRVATLAHGNAGWPDGHRLQNSRLTILFGSSATGYTTANVNRIDAISWIDSAGKPVANYLAQADRHCNDAIEYFGEAYGNGSNSRPYAVIGGVVSTWSGSGQLTGSTNIAWPTNCSYVWDAATASTYTLATSADMVNVLKITRKLTFSADAASGQMRVFVPRVPAASYPNVIYPDNSGTLHMMHAVTCNRNCVMPDWNGTWMADESATGRGIAVFRAPNPSWPAVITVDYDDDSASNASAITLLEPASGWAHKVVTETEYLCFYDAASWPASRRAAGMKPAGCDGMAK
jgi:DNA-binding winged helix-turn-helix (wHTH) protein